jgi:hypothetical protein
LGNLADMVKMGKILKIPSFLTSSKTKSHISIEKAEANPKTQTTKPKQISIFKIPMTKTTDENRLNLGVGICNLFVICDLSFGIFSLS